MEREVVRGIQAGWKNKKDRRIRRTFWELYSNKVKGTSLQQNRTTNNPVASEMISTKKVNVHNTASGLN